MMTPKAGLRELVQDLRATLDAIAGGLVDALPERLLETEPRLAVLTAALTEARHRGEAVPREDLLAARQTLRRCEALGLTLHQLGEVYAAPGGYTRAGRYPTPDAPGVLQARG